MGFFKNVGNKLKRVVSVKNLFNGLTGNFTAIGSDVQRVISTSDPKKSVNKLTDASFTIPQPISDILSAQDENYNTNLIKSVSDLKPVQDVNTWFTKVWLESQWVKYKTWIIGFLSVISFFILWKFVFSKKKTTRRR